MKKSFLIFIIYFSAFSLIAQNNFYGSFHSQIYNQQKGILKKESVKKIKTNNYYNNRDREKIASSEFMFFNSNGNIQEFIWQNFDLKETTTYAYDKLNNLKSEIITTKEGKFKKYGTPQGTLTSDFPVNKVYYNYDDKNRLIEEKLCNDDNVCKIKHIKYFGNKVYTYYQDINEKIEKIEVIERKDSIERKIELNKNNEIVQKSIIFYNKNSLKLKEERFKNDTLIYNEENKIDNNKIIQTIKSYYFKSSNTNEMNQSVNGTYFVYNSDQSIKTIKSVRTSAHNDDLWITRYEYIYNEKGLLIELQVYRDDKFKYSEFYKYNMR